MNIYIEENVNVYESIHKLTLVLRKDKNEVLLVPKAQNADILIGNPEFISSLNGWHTNLLNNYKWPIDDVNVGVILCDDNRMLITGANQKMTNAAIKAMAEMLFSITQTKEYPEPFPFLEAGPYIVIVQQDGSTLFNKIEKTTN